MIMRHCAEIYDEASGGRISKPTTLPFEVISLMHEQQRKDIDEAVAEATAEQDATLAALTEALSELHEYVCDWHESDGNPRLRLEKLKEAARAALARVADVRDGGAG